jgi:hypothetical protein
VRGQRSDAARNQRPENCRVGTACGRRALNAAQSDQTGAKSTLQTVQQQYDAWNSQHGGAADGPFVNVAQHGGPGHMMLTSVGPYQINPYTQQLSDARAALDAANNKVNQLQLMSDGAHDQVLFDQFNAGLSDNLLNPVTDSDKADYAKALDFTCSTPLL